MSSTFVDRLRSQIKPANSPSTFYANGGKIRFSRSGVRIENTPMKKNGNLKTNATCASGWDEGTKNDIRAASFQLNSMWAKGKTTSQDTLSDICKFSYKSTVGEEGKSAPVFRLPSIYTVCVGKRRRHSSETRFVQRVENRSGQRKLINVPHVALSIPRREWVFSFAHKIDWFSVLRGSAWRCWRWTVVALIYAEWCCAGGGRACWRCHDFRLRERESLERHECVQLWDVGGLLFVRGADFLATCNYVASVRVWSLECSIGAHRAVDIFERANSKNVICKTHIFPHFILIVGDYRVVSHTMIFQVKTNILAEAIIINNW